MPLYEYECEGGHKFEGLHSMADRHNVACPNCKRPAHIKLSVPRPPVMAKTFTTYGHDGSMIGQKQTTEKTPMLPEKVHGGRF